VPPKQQDLGSTKSLHNASLSLESIEKQEKCNSISNESIALSTGQVSASSDLTPTNVESKSFSTSSVTETVVVIERQPPNLVVDIEDDNQTIVGKGATC